MSKFAQAEEQFRDVQRHTPTDVKKFEVGEKRVGMFLGVQGILNPKTQEEMSCFGIETDQGVVWRWLDGYTGYEITRLQIQEGDVIGIEHQGKEKSKKDGREYNRSFVRVLSKKA